MKVLLVEDDKLFRRVAERVFASVAHTLFLAENGAQAIRIARSERPEVIFLDLHLPDFSGEDLLRRFKAHPDTRDARVFILSGSDPARVEVGLLALGAERVLRKPLTPVRMKELIEEG